MWPAGLPHKSTCGKAPHQTMENASMKAKQLQLLLTMLLIATGSVTRLFAACTEASLHGSYSYASQGFSEVPPEISPAGFVPWAQTGRISFDGSGTIPSGTFTAATLAAAGGVLRGIFAGTYKINADCTGTAELLLDDGGTFHFDLVVNGPASLTFINTDPNPNSFLSVYFMRRMSGAD